MRFVAEPAHGTPPSWEFRVVHEIDDGWGEEHWSVAYVQIDCNGDLVGSVNRLHDDVCDGAVTLGEWHVGAFLENFRDLLLAFTLPVIEFGPDDATLEEKPPLFVREQVGNAWFDPVAIP